MAENTPEKRNKQKRKRKSGNGGRRERGRVAGRDMNERVLL